MKSWIEFWDSEHAIYVNERHKQLHAHAVGRDIIRHIPGSDALVLDHGCGEANYAAEVAQAAVGCTCARRPWACGRRGDRTWRIPNIEVLDPAGVEALPDASLDLVVANSLVQYLTRRELIDLLGLWRRKLKPTGILVVADVLPPYISPLRDAASLLWFGLEGRVPAGGSRRAGAYSLVGLPQGAGAARSDHVFGTGFHNDAGRPGFHCRPGSPELRPQPGPDGPSAPSGGRANQ